VPGFGALAEIDTTRREFQIAGRTFHEPRFATPSGKLRLDVPPTTALRVGDGELRMMTLRSEGQFNTVVYEEEDIYRGTDRRDVVLINASDASRLGLEEGAPVTVETSTGSMRVVVAFLDIPPGNLAMYYPEANRLVPRRVDRASGTPAFKTIAARLVR
jgi:anaerobic selenocysteine-containing dehydrogenase